MSGCRQPGRLFAALWIGLIGLTGSATATAQQGGGWTPPPVEEIRQRIEDHSLGEAAALIRRSWGPKALQGKALRIEGTTVLWARQSDESVTVVRTDREEILGELVPLDDRGLRALALRLENFQVLPYELRDATGKVLVAGSLKIEHYDYRPDSRLQEGVPKGSVHTHRDWESTHFPDTLRDIQVYIPAQYEGLEPAALMVFQDGLRHADPEGSLRATTVFDNLIAKGEMPVTIGIFVNPGRFKDQKPGEKPRNRSVEYDSLGSAYVDFLLQELIPYVTQEHDLKLLDDPRYWGIAGGSSGCACAWTVAWERPDRFGKVLGWVGTFVDIRGANAYPSLIRKTERKPIRAVFLAGTNDLDNRFGNWPLANRQMEAALAFMDYDYRYLWGQCFHGSKHAGAELPEMLRWLWSDVSAAP